MQPQETTCTSQKGHWWQATTSPFVRRCFRTGCKAMQHCLNGVWYESLPSPQKPSATLIAEQTTLWDQA